MCLVVPANSGPSRRRGSPFGSPVRWGGLLKVPVVGLLLLGCDRPSECPPRDMTSKGPTQGLAIRPDSTIVLAVDSHRVAAIGDSQRLLWLKDFPDETVIAAPTAARDSTVFVLTDKHIHAFGEGGKPIFRWSHQASFEDGSPPERYQLLPMPDSNLVVCDGRRHCVDVDKQGQVRWQYRLPSGMTLQAPVAVGVSGSLYLRTESWLYVLSSQGQERWRLSVEESLRPGDRSGVGG